MLTKIIAAALLASSAAASSFLQRAAAPTRIWETAYTATDPAAVAAAKATAKTRSPTSQVAGKVFDRYVSIWFENTNFAKAKADRKDPSLISLFPRGH